MKNFISLPKLILLIVILLSSGTASADSYFSDTVHTVNVIFDSPDFWTELDATHETDEYMPCTAVFDLGDTFYNVGIKLKGNSSYGHPGLKKPFHIKLDEYVDDQEYRGLERFTFNNGFKDPTFIREKLASEIYHSLGVPCLRASFCNVYFNDEHWGFYSVVDPIDKTALTRMFGENDGNLYKGDPRGTMEWLGWGETGYRSNYEKSSNEDEDDWSDLISFVNFINNSADDVFRHRADYRFDVDGFARFWAANTYMVNLDSYQGSGHNYYFYFDEGDSVGRFIVWDINEAFGVFTNGYMGDVTLMPVDWYSDNRPLFTRLLEDYPDFRQLIDCALEELMGGILEYDTFSERVTELADLVRPYVYADDNKMYPNDAFETNLNDDLRSPGPMGSMIPGLRSFVSARSTFLDGEIRSCTEVYLSGLIQINEVMPDNDTTVTDAEGEFDDWIELHNTTDTLIDISQWFMTDDMDEPRKWSFPEGCIIRGGEYLVVWIDSDPEQGDYHASFSLAAEGEEIGLFGPDILGTNPVDVIDWIDMPQDMSFGRYPDGTDSWQICVVPTPGMPNVRESVDEDGILPEELSVRAWPNPFNSRVMIDCGMEINRIEILDMQGRWMTDVNPAGDGFVWSPDAEVNSGIYLVRVHAGGRTDEYRIVYLK